MTQDRQPLWDPTTGLNPTPAAPNGAPLAGFGRRLAARIIDGLIVTVVYLVVTVALRIVVLLAVRSTVAYRTDPGRYRSALILFELVLLAALPLLVYLYEVELVLRRAGQSPGKRFMKLCITPLDPGQPLDRPTLARRWGAALAVGVVPFGGLVDGLWQLWDRPYRQCLHDKVAPTVVVSRPGE